MSYTLGELASLINAELHGDQDIKITNIATLTSARSGDISFLANRRYVNQLAGTSASAVVLGPNDMDLCPVASLVVDDPHLAFARITRLFYPPEKVEPGIDKNAIIDESADIAASACIGPNVVIGRQTVINDNVSIGAGCVIGDSVTIGGNSRLYPNVFVGSHSVLGQNIIIHPGAVIGSDGFGLANDQGEWLKIPQIGRVVLGDDVEIGANTSIDKGALDDTIIEEGVKIDNQVQIGHNVRIGAHTAIAGCAAIAGSTIIGKRCRIGGAVGISGHISIADDVTITAMSGVANSIKQSGIYSSGIPAMEAGKWRRNVVGIKNLGKLNSRINKLEE